MKLSVLVLMLCAFAAAAPRDKKHEVFPIDILTDDTLEGRNILVNTLVTRLINYLRFIINNGSEVFDIPPLDPLALENFHINVPAGLINLNLGLKNIYATGFGAFVVHKSDLDLRDMTFDIDVSFPILDIRADEYDMVGDLFGAIPLYGKGEAVFKVDDLRFQAVLHLKQSEDGKSVLIDKIENTSFVIPNLKSQLTGAIGGGDIDAIVNAMIEDVVTDYINRFQSPISKIGGRVATALLNPILDQLDTWRYIAWLIPRI